MFKPRYRPLIIAGGLVGGAITAPAAAVARERHSYTASHRLHTAWRRPASWTSAPSIVSDKDHLYLIDGDQIRAYSAHSGASLWSWRRPWTKQWFEATDNAVIAGRFLVTTVGGMLFFIDYATGRLTSHVKLGSWCSSPMLVGDLASLVIQEDGTYAIARVSPSTGKRLSMTPVKITASSIRPWQNRERYRFLPRQSAPISSHTWLAKDERWFVTLRAQPPGVLGMRWTGPTCGLPAGAGNRLFQCSVLPDTTLGVQALDLKGKVIWSTELPYVGGGIFSYPPTAHHGKVFVFNGATAYAVEAATGKLLWIRRVSKWDGARDIRPFVFRGDLCVVPGERLRPGRSIVRIDSQTGRVRSRREISDGIAALTPHRLGMVVGYYTRQGGRLALLR